MGFYMTYYLFCSRFLFYSEILPTVNLPLPANLTTCKIFLQVLHCRVAIELYAIKNRRLLMKTIVPFKDRLFRAAMVGTGLHKASVGLLLREIVYMFMYRICGLYIYKRACTHASLPSTHRRKSSDGARIFYNADAICMYVKLTFSSLSAAYFIQLRMSGDRPESIILCAISTSKNRPLLPRRNFEKTLVKIDSISIESLRGLVAF